MSGQILRLLLVRHGQSEMNLEGRFYGRLDPALTELGKQQAAAQAGQLQAVDDIAACYTSPAQRAHQTAAIIGARLGLTPVVHEALWEQDFGEWEGLRPQDFMGPDPKQWRAWIAKRAYHPPGGEALDEVAARAMAWVDEVKQAHNGKTVLAVAHAGLLQAMLSQLLNMPLSSFWPFRFSTSGLADVRIFPEGPLLMAFNGPPGPSGPPG